MNTSIEKGLASHSSIKCIKGTTIHKVNNHTVATKQDIIKAIDRTKPNIEFQFKSTFQTPVHPETGTPQITFDQFVSIAKHH